MWSLQRKSLPTPDKDQYVLFCENIVSWAEKKLKYKPVNLHQYSGREKNFWISTFSNGPIRFFSLSDNVVNADLTSKIYRRPVFRETWYLDQSVLWLPYVWNVEVYLIKTCQII